MLLLSRLLLPILIIVLTILARQSENGIVTSVLFFIQSVVLFIAGLIELKDKASGNKFMAIFVFSVAIFIFYVAIHTLFKNL